MNTILTNVYIHYRTYMYYNTYSTCVCVLYKNLMSHFAIFIQQRINWLCSTKALLNKFWPKKWGLSFSERFFFGSSTKNSCNIDGSESRPAVWVWDWILGKDPGTIQTFWEGHSWQKVDFSSSFVYKSSCSWWEFE